MKNKREEENKNKSEEQLRSEELSKELVRKKAIISIVVAVVLIAVLVTTLSVAGIDRNGNKPCQHIEVVDKAVSATCTEAGLTEGKHCSVCNEVIVAQTVVPATGHTPQVIGSAIAPTCTMPGLTTGESCSVCGEILVAQEEISALGHAYPDEWTDNEENHIKVCENGCGIDLTGSHNHIETGRTTATCESAEIVTLECQCGNVTTEIGQPAIGHSYHWTNNLDGTCTGVCENDGRHTILAQAHIDVDDNNICDNCCEEIVCVHIYESSVTKPAGCLTEGTMTYTCTKCHDTYDAIIDALGHNEVIDEAEPATCTSTGLTEGSHCSVCNAVIIAQESIDALGHKYESEITKPAGCLTEGTMTYTCTKCHDTYDAIIDALGHNEVIDKAVPATCTSTGRTEGSHCSVCNAVIVAQERIDALGHNYVCESTTPAGCVTYGTETYACTVCGDSYTEMYMALGHDYDYEIVKEVDCVTEGVEIYTCIVCGDSYTEIIEPIGHRYVSKVTTHATCVTEGVETFTCRLCGDAYTETIAATGIHNVVIDEAVAPTCSDFGYTEGSHCSDCGEVYVEQQQIDKLPHTEVPTEAVAPTCTSYGYTEGSHCSVCGTTIIKPERLDKLEHMGEVQNVIQEVTCLENGYVEYLCSVCGYGYIEEIKAPGHNYESEIYTPAGCTTEGLLLFTCQNCGDAYLDIVAPTGHKYESEITKPADCVTEGIETFTCKNCGDTYTKTIAPTGIHDIVIDKAVPATCTETGLTEGKHCSACNEVLVAQTETEALGHNVVIDKAVPATCTRTGLTEGSHCSGCGEVYVAQQKTSALGHKEETLPAVPATCYETGLTAGKRCTVCGTTTVRQKEIPVTHSNVVIDPATVTCTEAGLAEGKHCGDCGAIIVEQVYQEALGHDIGPNGCTREGCNFCEYKFVLNKDKTAYTISGVGKDFAGGDIVLPSAVSNKPVVAISNAAFINNNKLTSVTLPDSITKIGNEAFRQCANLKKVTFNENAESITIGDRAFLMCTGLTDVVFQNGENPIVIGPGAFIDCTNLKNIVIPKNVISIGSGAFKESGLTSITFDENCSLTSISYGAFYGCVALEEIEIPASVQILEGKNETYSNYMGVFSGCTALKKVSYAENCQLTTLGTCTFYGCKSLTEIQIPASVTSIGSYAFYGCSSLADVYYLGTIEEWCNISFATSTATPMYEAENLYVNGLLVEDLVIPASVTSIGSYAFYGCEGIESVTFADNSQLATIGNYAFYNCTSLTEIEIPASVETICDYAFSKCGNMTSVTFADNSQLATIGKNAFESCKSLKELELPASLTSVADYAFYLCNGLVDVYVSGTLEDWCNISFATSTATPMLYADNLYVNGTLLEDVEIPATVTSINNYAFYNCKNITSVAFEDESQLTSIGIYAFYGCTSLAEIEIPTGATSIGNSAFYNCKSLAEIEIPVSVTSVGGSAFSGCNGLTNVYYLGTLEDWCNISFAEKSYCSNPMEVADNLYINGVLLEGELMIPESVTSIGPETFANVKTLTSVVIHANVTSIGAYAFEDCTGIASVTFADGSQLTTICDHAFDGCTSLTEIEIPSTVGFIGDYVFTGCTNLTTASLGENSAITTIPAGMFYDCRKLTGFVMPDGVTSIGYGAFKNCSAITEMHLPSGITSIESSVFYGCSAITEMSIPAGVTSIGDYAFSGCLKLASVTFEEGSQLTSIGNQAFLQCPLTEIDLPSTLKTIGKEAFRDCKFTEIVIPASVTSIGASAFGGSKELASIVVEDGNTKYKAVDNVLYTLDGTSLLLYAPMKQETSFVVPSTVKSIGSHAFAYCDSLTSVTFDENCTIKTIPDYAFYYCSNLSAFTIPESVTAIGKGAFTATALKQIVITSAVTTMGDSAFADCKQLQSVEILSNITYIDNYVFRYCSNLTTIVLPASMKTIHQFAFYNSYNLTDIYFMGTEAEWKQISVSSYNGSFTNATRHYYSECIHDNYHWKNDNYHWKYDSDGNITTDLTVGDWIVDVEATCTTNGSKHAICSVCGETITVEIPALGHIRGEDEKCTLCGEDVPYIITNDATYAFVENDGVLQSTNKAHNSSSSYVITACTTITITFEYNVSSESGYDKFYIYHNDTQKVVKSGTSNSYTSYSITLNAGDTLTFKYTKDGSTSSGDDCCYIKNLTITTVNN